MSPEQENIFNSLILEMQKESAGQNTETIPINRKTLNKLKTYHYES